MLDNKKLTTNYKLCKACGGICCKRTACDCSPKDFNNDPNKMKEALESGKYSIDFARDLVSSFVFQGGNTFLDVEKVKNNPHECFYIRPKNVNRPIVDFIHEDVDEGPCIFWSLEKGCELTYKERPTGGRTLIPTQVGTCIAQYNKEDIIEDWRPYIADMIKLVKEFFDSEWSLYKKFNFKIK